MFDDLFKTDTQKDIKTPVTTSKPSGMFDDLFTKPTTSEKQSVKVDTTVPTQPMEQTTTPTTPTFNKPKKFLSKVTDVFLKSLPGVGPAYSVYKTNKSGVNQALQPIIDRTLNTPLGKEIVTTTEKATRGSSLLYALPKAVYESQKDFYTGNKSEKDIVDYYDQAVSEWEKGGQDPTISFANKVARGVLDSGVQSAVGVLLNFIPVVGKGASTAYYGALSASEQVNERGQVNSLGNIGIDVIGDRILGDTLEGLFKKPVKDLIKTGFVETAKQAGKGFLVEGITEPSQTLLKYVNDYQMAKTPEQRQAIIEQTKDYVKNGGMLLEFLVGGISGAGISTLATIASQSQINPNIPKPKIGITEDKDKEFTPEQNKIRESFREDIKDNLSETGMNKPYVARQLSKETGIDNAITTLMVDEVAETIQTTPATIDHEAIIQQALNEAGSTLEETKPEETTGNPEALDFTDMGTATGDVVAESAMIPLKNAKTVLKNAGYSDSAINEIITSLADKVRSSLGRQSIKASDIKEAAFEYSTQTKTPEAVTEQPKLKPVYHGTNKVFKNFKDGSFFSTDKNFAKDYGSVGEPSYLDMKNTFDITNKKDFDLIAGKNGIEDPYDGKVYKTFEEYKNSPSFGNDTWEITEPYLSKIKTEGYDSARIFEGGIENFTALNKNIIQSKAQGETKMKISDKVSHEDKIKISKLLEGLDTTPLTVDGKPLLEDTELYFRLDQLKTKENKGQLSEEEYIEAKGLLEEAKLGLDTLKTKEDNKEYEIHKRIYSKTTTNGEIQNNIGDIRESDGGNRDTSSLDNRSKDGEISIKGRENESRKRIESADLSKISGKLEIEKIVRQVFPEAKKQVIDLIVFSNSVLSNIGVELYIQQSKYLDGTTNFDAGIQSSGNKTMLTLNSEFIADINVDSIWHEIFGHKWYQNLTEQQKELHFNKIKEQYNLDKKLFDKFLVKEYWEMFVTKSILNDIKNSNPELENGQIILILRDTGFINNNNEAIYPENILDTVFNFTPMSDKLNKYLRENGYNPSVGVLEYNNLMGEEINSYVAENTELFQDSDIPEVAKYASDIKNNKLEFIKPERIINFGGVTFKLKDSTKLTSADIIKKHANIQLKRDIVIIDVYGEKATLKAGEGITPYEVTGNKFILQDGEAYLVSKSQAQNVINNSKTGEAKPFAPELKQTEETIKGGTSLKFDDIKWTGTKENLNGKLGDRVFGIRKETKLPEGYRVDKFNPKWSDKQLYAIYSPQKTISVSGEELDTPQKAIDKFLKISDTNEIGWYVFEENAVLGKTVKNYTQAVEELNRYLAKENPTTRYSSYTLPGGENYKEILIKAPTQEQVYSKNDIKEVVENQYGEWEVKLKDGTKFTYPDVATETEAKNQFQKDLDRGRISIRDKVVNKGVFKSSHWEEPNVISHIRMNERTYNGKKVAFMEELQSDWAREGRDKGFIEPKKQLTQKQIKDKIEQELKDEGIFFEEDMSGEANIVDKDGEFIDYDTLTPRQKSLVDNYVGDAETYQEIKEGKATDGVPYNPLLKNWQELSIKRALQEAVNTNAKYFAWINGPQTAARYNLSKEVDSMEWNYKKAPDVKFSTREVIITPKEGQNLIKISVDTDGIIQSTNNGSDWDGKKLDEVIGKGVAEKIMASENGKLEGEGLNFGGQWAKNLYDKQVKAIVENLTGQKVEMLDMGLAIDKRATKWRITKQKGFEMFADTDIILDESNIQVGDTVTNLGSRIEDIKDTDKYVITDILGNGKFKAVPKKSFNDRPFPGIKNIKLNNKYYAPESEQTFDISTKTAQQMGIELTPEVKAIIKGEAPQVKVSGKLPFTEQITAPVMFKLKQPISIPVNEKLKDSTIKEIFNERRDEITPTTGEYQFKTKDEVLTFINKNKGKKFMSSVINAHFEVNELTKIHMYIKDRPQADYDRRTKLFGPGLEIAESKGILIGIDAITDKEKGITYYNIIGIDPSMPNIIIKVTLSEENKNGKAYFTVSEISGGAPVPATPSSGRRPGRITTSESITESIPLSEKESQVGDVKFKIKLPDVNTGNRAEDAKQILAHVEKKLGVTSIVNSIKEKETAVEIAKEVLNESPASQLEEYVADAGDFKGQLPEVTGQTIEELKKNKAFRGVKNQKAIEFAKEGDRIATDIFASYGIEIDSEQAREEFNNYKEKKEVIKEKEKELKVQKDLFKTTDTFKLAGIDKTLIGEITQTREMPQAIMQIMEQVKAEKKARREEVLNHPARPLMKYVDKKTQRLPKIGSKTAFGKEGEQILKDLKFDDVQEANKSLADYIAKRTEFVNPVSRLALQERAAKFLRDKQKILEEVEKKIRAEGRDRKSKLEAIRDFFYMTEGEMKDAIGDKDYRLLSENEFQKLLEEVREKSIEIAQHTMAVSEVEWTIAERELHRVENMQEVLGYPKDLNKLTTEQLDNLNQTLGKFEKGDVFLGVREMETLAKNAGLPDVKTQRQILEEVLGKKTGLSVEELQKIVVGSFDEVRSAVSLARQNAFYEVMVSDFYQLKIEAELRYREVEKKTTELVRKARQSRPRNWKQKFAPTDDMVIAYLEEGDLETKSLIAKDMTKAELELAHYIQERYAEMRDFLVSREQLKGIRENYYTHRPRGFFEAWLRQDIHMVEKTPGIFEKESMSFVRSFGRAFKETFIDVNKMDEATFKILNEQTEEILPLEKFFKYSMRRSGQLIPTKNLATAFLGYTRTFELKKGLDQYMPRIEATARALTPTETTEGGIIKDTSLEKFVKKWINTQKGRPVTTLGFIQPGGVVDGLIRSGISFTRFLDLALRIPAQAMSMFGEESMTWINIGTKQYLTGQYRAKTAQGNKIAKKYESFVGTKFWDKMREESKGIGSKLGETVYAFYGIAGRNANIHHLLGVLTKQEFESGNISAERLVEVKMEMNRWRADDLLHSVVGKTSIGAMFRQHKSWAIPPVNQTLSNLKTLTKMTQSGEYLTAAKSKEFGELFRATTLTLIVVLTVLNQFRELKEKKERTFVEELQYRAMMDIQSFIEALSPATLGSIPRLAGWFTDLTKAVTLLIGALSTGDRTSTGDIPGLKGLRSAITPKLVKPLFNPDEEDKIKDSIATSTIKAQKELDEITSEITDPAQKVWEEVKKVGVGTDEANDLVSEISDEEYEAYKLVKKADDEYWSNLSEKVTPIVHQAFKLEFGTEEANKLVEDLSDDEYEMYKKVKSAFYGKGEATAQPSDWDQQSFITKIGNLAKGWTSDPVDAFNKLIRGGDWKITGITNGQIIVDRMPVDASEKLKAEVAKNNKNWKGDHVVPIKLGGGNDKRNFNIIPTEQWEENTPVEIYLINQLKAGNITGKQGEEFIIRYKGGQGQFESGTKMLKVYEEKYNSEPLTFEEIKQEIAK